MKGRSTEHTVEPFSIYVHIPYCRLKCPYCDFNVYTPRQWPEAAYTEALTAELQGYVSDPAWRERPVQSIYFGGGTPSLFAPASIARITRCIMANWPLTPECEITLEANPGTVDAESLQGYRAAAVNRVSFGVQSFDDRHLRRLGRDHTAEEAVEAVRLALTAGFEHVSLDLIFAVPGQTIGSWEEDLRTALSLAPHHISAYNLTYEEGTPFFARRASGQLSPVSNEDEALMFMIAHDCLTAASFEHYEISNYARSGHRSRHNENYWLGGDYLGIGCGAHSYTRTTALGVRWSNERHPERWMKMLREQGHARVFEERLSESQARGEFVFLALRQLEGFDEMRFAARFGTPFLDAFPHASDLARDGLLTTEHGRWRLTARGLLVADTVFATFC